MSKTSKKVILITSGDTDGIGSEIIQKALSEISLSERESVIVIGEKCNLEGAHVVLESSNYEWTDLTQNKLSYVESGKSPGHWVEWATKLGLSKKISALVTAPLSKTGLRRAGFKDKGHTDIFRRVSSDNDLYMCFLGDEFCVSLVTDHVPFSEIHRVLRKDKIIACAKLSRDLLEKLNVEECLKIGILGLNPHSGEEGIIGSEEIDTIRPAIKELQRTVGEGFFHGPLVPDVAFQRGHRDQYKLFIAMYHDQGLIPFKALNPPHSGCQLTLGLDFIRTSVDHGTAKDIAGKGIADHRSFLSALEWARRLA